jgi:hypothetical protein
MIRNGALVVALVVLLGLASVAHAQDPFVMASPREAFASGDPSPTLMRQRAVDLNFVALGRAAADAAGYLQIAFFDDAVFQIRLTGQERTHSGGTAYVGRVALEPASTAVIVDNQGTVSIRVSVPGRRFSIVGSAARGYVARELAQVKKPDHPRSPIERLNTHALTKSSGYVEVNPIFVPPPVTARDDGSTMDVMVLYTPAARAANGGTGAMNAEVDAEIAITNAIYASSNVVQRLRLVYKGETAYTETEMDTDLDRIASTSDGFMDEAPILRDLYGADFVSLWGVYSSACGIGFLMATESSSFASAAYNVVDSPGCTGPGVFTFAHELGHNMGLRHDNYQDGTATTRVTPEAGGVLTDVTYAHGYVDLINRFRTVMSYNDQCVAGGFNCTRVPYFSNPSVLFTNSPFSAVAAPTGNAVTAHERQALNDTRETTANFRMGLSSFTGPGSVLFVPASYSVSESGGSVLLTVARHRGSSGAISIDYATMPGSASAGADFTMTSGTLNWADGDTSSKTITVAILPDSVLEGEEIFTVQLSGATGGSIIPLGGGSGLVRIVDDEPDTFPTGATVPSGFTTPNNPNANTPDTRWTVDTTQGYTSSSSLGSANMLSPSDPFSASSTWQFGFSDLEYAGTFVGGNISFHYKLSGYHNGFSGFEFHIDGAAVFSNNVGGEVGWTQVTQPITAGSHTLRWRFKNRLPFPCANANPAAPGGVNCQDRAWIDAVSLPLASPPGPQLLTVALGGDGTGTVTSSPSGINCSGDCTESYAQGTAVTLTATAGTDSVFSGWSGGGCVGTGNCTVTMNAATTVTATFSSASNPPRVYGISTRARVLTGDNVMIAGVIIGGSTPKTVVVRARGPSLGVAGGLNDPTLTLVPADGSPSTTNDDWGNAANSAALAATGFQPAHAKEAAIMATLAPGAYTAIVSGVGNTTGVAIVEVYELDAPSVPVVGIATRSFVNTGDNVMIAGIIVQGSGPQTVVVRARGPSLGVAGALANPTLTLVPADGSPSTTNDDWQSAANGAALAASGFAPSSPLESAILVTLNPGAYTAIVSGVGNTTGVAIVEVYRQ